VSIALRELLIKPIDGSCELGDCIVELREVCRCRWRRCRPWEANGAREGYESMLTAAKERIAGIEAKLAADRERHQAAVDEHERAVEAHKATVKHSSRKRPNTPARLPRSSMSGNRFSLRELTRLPRC
jgi:hypothetical protein